MTVIGFDIKINWNLHLQEAHTHIPNFNKIILSKIVYSTHEPKPAEQ